ncbi:MAG: hypothetical protein ACMUIA_09515 [bacterium]
MIDRRELAVRWTIGDVSPFGFEALRLAIWGAFQLFGPKAAYAVCFNSVSIRKARRQTGDIPSEVLWHDATDEIPDFLKKHLDGNLAEGAGWKFAPIRLFPDRYELALDNDCLLWNLPQAVARWGEDGNRQRCILAEDVKTCFGQFAALCGSDPRNCGIRGFPPGFDFAESLRLTLEEHPVLLSSELDEQGLQAAALSRPVPPLLVTIHEVTICSPFPPHLPYLGCCGAHFVGLNASHLPWSLNGRTAVTLIREHWLRHRPALEVLIKPSP